jgi:hypothetical protein
VEVLVRKELVDRGEVLRLIPTSTRSYKSPCFSTVEFSATVPPSPP